jgi:serine/threonine-protein kinase
MDPGQTFGSYRLLEPLGEGGFGQVWRAVDLRLERQVALKLIKGTDVEHQRLLLQEARTACQLHHPNIATIFEVGEIESQSYIAMELVEGRGFRGMLGRPLEAETLQKLAFQAASALHAAHQKGIVHRDIKPENLMLTAEGDLKILDFGVAKRALAAGDETHQALTQSGLTSMGLTTGTPAYMSPEQARSADVGPASDQFSLGLVLWELAAGRHPFRRAVLFETLHAISHETTPTLYRERPDLHPAFLEGIHRMLAKEPHDRFPDLLAFRHVLETRASTAWRVTGVVPALTVAPKSGVRVWLWVGLATALAGGALWFFLGGAGRVGLPGQPNRRVLAILPLEQMPPDGERAWMGVSFADAIATGLLGQQDLLVLDRARILESLGRHGEKPGDPIRSLNALVKDLKANLLLLGSCQTSGEQLRLTLRLVDGPSGGVVKQVQFSGTTRDLLGLEDQLSQRLPALLGLRQSGRDLAAGSRAKSPRTRELFAKAADRVLAGSPAAYEEARKLYEEALTGEPEYAPAHAGLAWALLELAATEIHLGRRESHLALTERAETEARRALALDPSLSGAHRVLAWSALRKGDYPGARLAGRQALALDPGDFRIHIVLGDAEAYDDAPAARARARDHFRQVLELGPADWFGHLRYAVFLQNEGNLREAIQEAEQAIALQPTAEYAHLCASVSRLWLGEVREARAKAEAGLVQVPTSRLLRATLALTLHAQGDGPAFLESLKPLHGAWPPDHVIAVLLKGLEDDLAGHPEAMRGAFQAYGQGVQKVDFSGRPVSERRALSVNLYHMARAAALRGDRSLAETLMALAEKLHPGKRRIAQADPAFKG